VRERFTVDDLVWDVDRVVGLRGHSSGGATVTEHARIVVGADGLHSTVARFAQAPSYDVRPVFTCAYYSYWSDLPIEAAELYARPDRMIVSAGTNDGLTIVIVYWPIAAFHEVRTDIERHFLAALDLAPRLAERVRTARRAEHFRGTADQQNVYRRPYGPGWALVGDAGYHKDPITAQGISDAFRDAELLAGAIDDGFSGRLPLDEALAGYERRRNEVTRPHCAATRSRPTASSAPSSGPFPSRSSSRRRTSDGSWPWPAEPKALSIARSPWFRSEA
jgi:flavin-dependent dehydrogenase